MEALKHLLSNSAIGVPIISWLLAQICKLVVNLAVEHKLELRRFFSDGGMPSGHSATVTALMVVIGWTAGLDTPLFALAAIFAVVVMRDAMGVRREAGKHAKTIKEMAEVINSMLLEKDKLIRGEKLKELVGHTPLQVFFGMLLGLAVSVGYCLINDVEYASECVNLFTA